MINFRIRNFAAVTLALTLVSSCNLYKKYESSASDNEALDSLYSYIEATNNTDENIASKSWDEFFTDPILQNLIEEGLVSNTDLRVAQLSIEQSEIALKTSRLAYIPTLGLSAGAEVSTASKPSYSLTLSSSWEIDVFGKLTNAKEKSKVALEASKAYVQTIQTGLVATIAANYYSLLMLDEQLDISSRTLVAWEENLRTITALKDAGRLNQTSVYQSEASKVALESSIVTIKQQIFELENTLCALLGRPTTTIERGSLSDVAFPSELSVGLPIELLSNRPDVRYAEYNLAQTFYSTNIARGSLYPSITLGGSAGYSYSSGVSFNLSDIVMGAVASIVQPIFNQGKLRAELKIAKITEEQALLEFNQTLIDAGAEVNAALTQYQSAQQRITHDTAQLELLEKALKSSELLMLHGNVNYLEVLTAQFSLLSAQLTYASDKFSEVEGAINLYRSLGGGID
ncbi:MAG: efflux transporter outer membrane subunit [Rikenellaceae bacterium]